MNEQTATETISPERLARALVRYYNEDIVPAMVEEFDSWGFDKETLAKSNDAFFLFLVLSAYDRQPYTRSGAYDRVWAADPGTVRRLIEDARLHRVSTIQEIAPERLETLLRHMLFGRLSLAGDGRLRYAETFKDVARQAAELREYTVNCKNTFEVASLHWRFDQIHGVAATIAAKLVKYLLREIDIGQVSPADFPTSIARHLIAEQHVRRALERLDQQYSRAYVSSLWGELEKLEDTFAIDALFYADRHNEGKIPRRFLMV
jgi:hypothetical protein